MQLCPLSRHFFFNVQENGKSFRFIQMLHFLDWLQHGCQDSTKSSCDHKVPEYQRALEIWHSNPHLPAGLRPSYQAALWQILRLLWLLGKLQLPWHPPRGLVRENRPQDAPSQRWANHTHTYMPHWQNEMDRGWDWRSPHRKQFNLGKQESIHVCINVA